MSIEKAVVVICLVYLVLVCVNGLMHALALMRMPQGALINIEGANAGYWLGMNFENTLRQLFFPVMLLFQALLLGSLKTRTIIRSIAVVFLISLAAIFYQGLVDPEWLTEPYWQRMGRQAGFDANPNAFAFNALLLSGLLIAGFRLEKTGSVKWCYLVLLVLLVMASSFTGNRTGMAAIFLLLILLPAVVAISKHSWTRSRRLFVGGAPFVVMLLSIPVILNYASELGPAGERLERSWEQVNSVGVAGFLNHYTVRDDLFSLGLNLTKQSPWGGWGPGGFYREYSNVVYKQTGLIQPAFEWTPLNHYLHVAVDLGLPVLFLTLIIVLGVPWFAIKVMRREGDEGKRFFIGVLLLTQLIFLLMIFVMPVFSSVVWIWTASIAILLTKISRFPQVDWNIMKRILLGGGTLLGAISIFGFGQATFGIDSYEARRNPNWWNNDKGFCSPALGLNKKAYWCDDTESIRFPVGKNVLKRAGSDKLQIRVDFRLPDLRLDESAIVRFTTPSGINMEREVRGFDWHMVLLPLEQADLEYQRWIEARKFHFVTLGLHVKRGPRREAGQSRKTIAVRVVGLTLKL